MIVDIHSHLYPRAYLKVIGGGDEREQSMASDSPAAVASRLEEADRAGISLSIISAGARAPGLEDLTRSVDAAQTLNDGYRAIVAQHPGRFLAYASLPLPHVEAAVEELGRIWSDPAFVGVTIPTSVAGLSLAAEEYAPIWAALDDRAAVVLLHPAGVAAGSALIAQYGGTWTIGSPIEDTVAALHLIKSGLLVRHRRMKVIVPHLGGLLPSLVRRLDELGAAAGEPAPSELVAGLYFDTVNGHPPALRAVVETVGYDHVLYGSDFPYWNGEALVHSVEYVANAGLKVVERDAVYAGNALRLHGLGDRDPGRGRNWLH